MTTLLPKFLYFTKKGQSLDDWHGSARFIDPATINDKDRESVSADSG
ncbi:MAG TPA: hypothetical protein VFY68_08025 [Nitrososphaeraceae archaeon]|nr:hypothetical protein [Nitrososphaeraceae archaeon]